MYDWRRMTAVQRAETLAARRAAFRPWHSPPHRFPVGCRRFLVSAACYEHTPVIGQSGERMDGFAERWQAVCEGHCDRIFAWCLLPNHYHVVLQSSEIKQLLHELGLLHGRTSFEWNGEDLRRGRKVWCNDVERELRSENHLWASINYVHHNPVKHGYVERWQDWPWSSAGSFLEEVGRERAMEIWRLYPVGDYGKSWDLD